GQLHLLTNRADVAHHLLQDFAGGRPPVGLVDAEQVLFHGAFLLWHPARLDWVLIRSSNDSRPDRHGTIAGMRWAGQLLALVLLASAAGAQDAPKPPLLRTVDLEKGESQRVELSDGAVARVKLLDVEETRDSIRSAIRLTRVKVE